MTSEAEVAAWLARPQAHGLPADAVVESIVTHAARVALAGGRAVKVKRWVDLGYLDFTTAEKRREALVAELALNAPHAPGLYERVVAVTKGPDGALAFEGEGETVDWALVMARFDQADLLASRAAAGPLPDELAEAMGEMAARLHHAAPHARSDGLAPVRAHAQANAAGLRTASQALGADAVEALIAATQAEIGRASGLLRARAEAGFVRRGHGDLHLANIVIWRGAPAPFDALEFDERLATIDILFDLGFLLMDCRHRGQPRAANRILNIWLDRMAREPGAEDAVWRGLALLPLFLSLRAATRAHVEAARPAGGMAGRAYAAFARSALLPVTPRLIAIGGRSGTGKSTLAKALAPALGPAPGAVVLRTDEIRKRLNGVGPYVALPREAYGPESHAAVYAALFAAAAALLEAGRNVVLDAAFLDPVERRQAALIARARNVDFEGLWLDAPAAMLAARVAARRRDASDAGPDVVASQHERALGSIAWTKLDAGREPAAVLADAEAALRR